MSSTIEDVAYDMYLEDLYEQDLKYQNIEEFRRTTLRRYYLKNPNILKKAQIVNQEAIKLYKDGHYTASLIFSFTAVELLVREIIVRPLLHGSIIDEDIAEYITEEILKKMKNYSHYSKMFAKFAKYHGGIDVKKYENKNLIQEFEDLQIKRNDALHRGRVMLQADARTANSVSLLHYNAVRAIIMKLDLSIDTKSWKISEQ